MNKEKHIHLSENRLRTFFSQFANAKEIYINGTKEVVYTFHRCIDNKFSLSYHLKFPQKKVQFNFWFDKISYLNSNERLTVSFHNSNERFEKDKLKQVLETNCLNVLEKKVKEIFKEYEYV